MAAAKWQEIYDGTPGEERVAFEELARDILRVQLKTKRRSKSSAI